ncbi:replication initiation protein RepC [Methylobacterium sp. ID0610]
MGDTAAAITVAAILQRGSEIGSAGGYLRALSRKARTGEFSLGPVLVALVGRHMRAEVGRAASPRPAGTRSG